MYHPCLCVVKDERSSYISRDDSMAPSKIYIISWIIIPRVSDKLVELEEVTTEIRNTDPRWGSIFRFVSEVRWKYLF